MNRILKYTLCAALPLALLMPLGAQSKKDAKNAKEAGITREQADQILDELRQIRQLLEKQLAEKGAAPAPGRVKLNLEGAPMLGRKDAPITVVEFTDYQCPFCRQFHTTVYNDLKKNFIDTGKVRFYSRDLPLDSIHPDAFRAAQAARCAADQGQFWTMRDTMGANPGKLDMESLVADASNLKMNADTFRTCVQSEKYREAVQTDVLEAMKIGAEATPTFVIGQSTPQGVDGELLVGSQPYSAFMRAFSKVDAAK
jgi:protein-disulfide isomerase